ncbi:P-loop containing nucleoside triphosphate hydrolase protein [Nemania sp. FL0031]|nr:P-loop containing nucleoside triphosphate hydrolase protein [Nemania sp. FL0031]
MSPGSTSAITPPNMLTKSKEDSSSSWCSSSTSSSPGFVKVPQGNNYIVNSKIVQLPIYFPPSCVERRKYFQPRPAELKKISDILIPNHSSSLGPRPTNLLVFAMTGLGGSGKTELVHEFIRIYRSEFDAIFYLVSDSHVRLSDQFTRLATVLGLAGESERSDQTRCLELVKLWLENPIKAVPELGNPNSDKTERARWLLIFDNADNPDILDQFWPHAGYGSVLVTSRSPLARCRFLNPMETLEVGSLPLDDAVSLLKYLTENEESKDPQSDDAARAIAVHLDSLPLAIDQIGTIIVDRRMSIVQFAAVYSQTRDYHSLYGERHLHQGYEHSLASVWAFENLEKEAFAVLCVVAFLDPEGIDEALLDPAFCDPQTKYFPTDTSGYHYHLSKLLDTSMLEKDRDTGRVRIHRLVQDVARAKMAEVPGALSTAFNDAFSRVASQWPFLNRVYVIGSSGKVDRWSKCDSLFPHILHLCGLFNDLLSSEKIEIASVDFAELALEAAQWRMECGHGHHAGPLIDLVETIYNSLDKSTHTRQYGQLYRAKVILACDYRNGDECLRFARLEIEQEQIRADQEGRLTSELAIANNNMAMAHAYCGEFTKALPYLARSEEIRKQLPGFKRFNLYSPLVHLGVVYNCIGETEKATTVLTQALDDRQCEIGRDDRVSLRTASIYYALGKVRLSQGDLKSSLALHQEALHRAREIAGPTNRSTLRCMFQVARVLAALGKHAEAYEHLNTMLCNSINYKHNERETAGAAYLFATCCKRLGKHTEARSWLKMSLEIHNALVPSQARMEDNITESDVFGLVIYDNINC